MAEYSGTFEEESGRLVNKTPEQIREEAEQKLADPAFMEFAKAAARKRNGEKFDDFLKNADSEAILNLSNEYEKDVVPVIKQFTEFFEGNFFNKFSTVIKKGKTKKIGGSSVPAADYLGDAKKKVETFLARQAVEEPDKFAEYDQKFIIYNRLEAQASAINSELMGKYGSINQEQIDSFRWQADENVRRGTEALEERKETFDGAMKAIRQKPWYFKEGAAIRWSRFKNRLLRRGDKKSSDAEYEEQTRYNLAVGEIERKIAEWQTKADVASRDIEVRESFDREIPAARDELLEALDASSDIRKLLMTGLEEAVASGQYDVAGMGEALGAVNERWGEFDSGAFDNKKEYKEDQQRVMEMLKGAFEKVLDDQKKSAERSINPTKLQEFGNFIHKSITSPETKKLAEVAINTAIKDTKNGEPDSPKLAHLVLMQRRLVAKTF